MQNRSTAITLTVASVLLCGLPGICCCFLGAVTALGLMPYNTTLNEYTSSGTVPSSWGYATLCLALILILIPILVGVFTLRKKPALATVSDENLPPTS